VGWTAVEYSIPDNGKDMFIFISITEAGSEAYAFSFIGGIAALA
jgi:hypothetical protein